MAAVRQRLQAWWLARLPRTDTWKLHQRNVYILPTKPGWMLALTLLVLLVASINYQLNLGYLLTFLLAGSAVVSMHVCHGNLRGLTLTMGALSPKTAGENGSLEVQLSSDRSSTRYSIAVSANAAKPANSTERGTYADVLGHSTSHVQVAFTAPARGLHAAPTLTLETLFPLGIFKVWTVWRPAADLLVYPAPEAHAPPLPAGLAMPGHASSASMQTTTPEADGVRAYRRGDPLKWVVWKKVAQTGQMVSRDQALSHPSQLWLDASTLGHMPLEARLSRMAAWVLAAERAGHVYGLRLPQSSIEPAQGEAHKKRCLEALALC